MPPKARPEAKPKPPKPPKPSREQRRRANVDAGRRREAKAAAFLKWLAFRPGYARSGPTAQGTYAFTKGGGRGYLAAPTDPPLAAVRRGILLYTTIINGKRFAFYAERQADGTYSVSRLLKGEYVDKKLRDTSRYRAPTVPGGVNGLVPLYALLDTNRVANADAPAPPKNTSGLPAFRLANGDTYATARARYVAERAKLRDKKALAAFDASWRRAFSSMKTVPRYGLFDDDNTFRVQEYTANEKRELANPPPPPLCAGRPIDLRDGNPATSCFLQGMQQRLAPALRRLEEGRTSGADSCAAGAALNPHQIGIYELARALAGRKPQDVNGFRGMLVWHNTGSGKCLGVDELVLTYDCDTVRAGDLRPGMRLMGPDGTPRNVLDVGRGVDDMYEIRPTKGEAWTCNAAHILSLRYNRHGTYVLTPQGYTAYWHEYANEHRGAFRTRTFASEEDAKAFVAGLDKNHVVDMPVTEYLALPAYMHRFLELFRAPRLCHSGAEPLALDPYVLGAWLGDGSSRGPQFTLVDDAILREIERRSPGLVLARHKTAEGKAASYRLRRPDDDDARDNPVAAALRKYGLVCNKHVPGAYKRASVQDRLALLAGLLDTDGHLQGNCYEITQKSEVLAHDIAFVARSLGYAAYVKPVRKECVKPDGERVPGTYHSVRISGAGLEDIPVALDRKRAAPRRQIKDALCTGFKVVSIGKGEYAGPVVDGDHRYLLADLTVTHNTVTSLAIALAFWDTPRNIMLVTTPANEADNNLKKYAQNMFAFFPAYAAKIFAGQALPPRPWTLASVKDWCNSRENIAKLTRRISTYTFTTFASELGYKGQGYGRDAPLGPDKLLRNGGKGSLVIMDEVQSLFTPDPKYKKATGDVLKEMSNPENAKNMYVFALTATPGNNVGDMIKVLNFVRPLAAPAFTVADAADPAKFRGLVSYVDIRSDTTRYGKKSVQNIYVPLDRAYYTAFLKTITLTPADLDYARYEKSQTEMKFLLKQRTAGNFVNKTAAAGVYSDADVARLLAQRPVPGAVKINGNQVRLVSNKLVQVLKNALEMPGKQYVWVAELNTAKVVARMLEAIGYAQVDGKAFVKAPDEETGRTKLEAKPALQSPGRRFILYKKGQANGELLDDSILKAFADYYNDRANDNGQRCKIMLATETYYQGLDMRALQGVHLADTLFNATADKQAVGRALRLCGHSGAPAKLAVVHRYFALPPQKFDANAVNAKGAAKKALAAKLPLDKRLRELPGAAVWRGASLPEGTGPDVARLAGVNMYVFADAARRYEPVLRFELGLKAMAIDCPLFKMAYHRSEPFQCGQVPKLAPPPPLRSNAKANAPRPGTPPRANSGARQTSSKGASKGASKGSSKGASKGAFKAPRRQGSVTSFFFGRPLRPAPTRSGNSGSGSTRWTSTPPSRGSNVPQQRVPRMSSSSGPSGRPKTPKTPKTPKPPKPPKPPKTPKPPRPRRRGLFEWLFGAKQPKQPRQPPAQRRPWTFENAMAARRRDEEKLRRLYQQPLV